MQFQILIYNNAECEAAIMGELNEELHRTHGELIAELQASGEFVTTDELSTDAAIVVRADRHDPKRIRSTDGPYSESKEWVGGFYIIDVESIDRAVEIAGRFVEARFSPIEVRQMVHASKPATAAEAL